MPRDTSTLRRWERRGILRRRFTPTQVTVSRFIAQDTPSFCSWGLADPGLDSRGACVVKLIRELQRWPPPPAGRPGPFELAVGPIAYNSDTPPVLTPTIPLW